MNQLKILPPEKAREKARAKVADFQREKRKQELEKKREPSVTKKKRKNSAYLARVILYRESLEAGKNLIDAGADLGEAIWLAHEWYNISETDEKWNQFIKDLKKYVKGRDAQ